MEEKRDVYLEHSTRQEYELALAYGTCVMNTATWRITPNSTQLRHQTMTEMVSWILAYEKNYYGNDSIFLSGPNVRKNATTPGANPVLGDLLSEQYGEEYFVIGSEAYENEFIAWDYKTEEPQAYHVVAQSEARLATVFHQTGLTEGYLSFEGIEEDSQLGRFLHTSQPFTMIGTFMKAWEADETMSTAPMVPAKSFDAMIILKHATPATMLK